MDEWTINVFVKRAKLIGFIVKVGIFLFIICYIYFFVRVGLSISETSEHEPFGTFLYALIFVIAAVIIFFIYNFSGGFDFDLKWIGFFIGLAVGGAIIGLIAGLLQSLAGYTIGGILGVTVITLTLRSYLKPKAQS